MKLLSERNQVREVAARWRARYPKGANKFGKGKDHDATYERLAALDVETATAADVAAIIGNTSWVTPKECHECDGKSWDVVELGEKPDWESATANICRACLAAALALVPASPEGGNGK